MKFKRYLSLLLSVVLVAGCFVSLGSASVFAADAENLFDREVYYAETMTAHSQFDVSDPNHVTDAQLFGAYNGTTWTTAPSLDYAKYSGLAAVEAAAKAGNYALCKTELLKYYKDKFGKLELDAIGGKTLDERSRVKAEAVFDNMFFAENSDTVAGRITFNGTKTWRPMDMTDEIKRVAKGTYGETRKIKYQLVAARKDGYYIEIDSRESNYDPYVVVRVNGQDRTYYAVSDTYVAKGSSTTKYGSNTKLLVEESVSSIGNVGVPVDNNTKAALIQFDFSDISSSDTIQSAKLYLRGQMKESSSKKNPHVTKTTKDVYVTSWQISTDDLNESTMDYSTYNSIGSCYQNFDGEGYPTYKIDSNNQLVGHKHVVGMREYLSYVYDGYKATGEEVFAYHFIRVMQGLIKSVGDYDEWERVSNLHKTIYWYPFEVAMVGHTVAPWMPYIIQSQSMTADAWTNIVKHFYLCGEFLVNNWNESEESNNYGIYSALGLGTFSMYYPEFAVVDDPLGAIKNETNPGSKVGGWTEVTKYRMSYKILSDFNEDGHSVEIPSNYALDSVTSAMGLHDLAESVGVDPKLYYTDELVERLVKACEWQLYHLNPKLGDWQVGDAGTYNTYHPNSFQAVLDLQTEQHPNLLWAASWRKKGAAPTTLTKVNDEPGKVTFRNSWDETAVAAHMENSGGAASLGYSHGHNDDLSLTVAAYGQYLLVDPMMGYYDVTEPKERWASSTRGHNTIEINDTIAKGHKYYSTVVSADLFGETMNVPLTQYASQMGNLHPENRELNKNYDYVRGETFGYTDNNALDSDYQVLRDVLFMHDGYFVVTDYIDPEDDTKTNSYTQPWHFLPEANPSVDTATYTTRTNFADSANIIVATVKKDSIAAPALKRGLYAKGKNNFGEVQYPYFEQQNKGITTFSTLLYPLPAGTNATVTTQALSLDIPDTQANAFSATVTDATENTVQTISYYNLFDETQKASRAFGSYATDGSVALVDEKNGDLHNVVLRNGTQVKYAGREEYLLYSESEIADLGVKWADGDIYLTSSKITGPTDALLSGLTVMAQQTIEKVYLNDASISFNQSGNYVYFDDEVIIRDTDVTAGAHNLTIKALGGSVENKGVTENASTTPVVVTPVLTDGVTFNYAQAVFRNKAGGSVDFNNAGNAAYVLKFANSTADKILEFNWEVGKAVRRLDFWIGDDNCFTGYEIQIPNGSGGWKKHAEGTMIYAASAANNSRQADYHAILFDPVPENTTSLRFVMKGCTKEIYVTEARVSTVNEYNLVATETNKDIFDGTNFKWYGSGTTYQASKYYSGNIATHALFSGETANNQSGGAFRNLNQKSMVREFGLVWPAKLENFDKHYLTPNANGDCWYAVSFAGRYDAAHEAKANHFKVKLNAGSAEGFEVYYTNNADAFNALMVQDNTDAYPDANVDSWTKLDTYSNALDADHSGILDIANAPTAAYWMVRLTNPTATVQVADIQMHQLAEDELMPNGDGSGEELPAEYILAIDSDSSTLVTDKLTDGVTLNWIQLTYRHKTVGSYWYYDAVNTPYAQVFANDTNNKTLEFKWEEGKAIRRLDLWMACNNPFTTYEIQISDGEGGWTKHAEGTMTVSGDTRQYNYYPLLFDPIPADSTALRLVMKNVTKQIYISEARISESNEYNLIAYGGNAALLESDDFTSYGEKNGNSASYNADHYFSGNLATHALFSGFVSSSTGGSGYLLNKSSMVREFGMLWPAHMNLGNTKGYLSAKTNAAGKPECYYAVDFSGRFAGEYPIKVNRIKVNMNAGSAKGFTVYSGDGTAFAGLMSESGYPDVNTSAWTKVATYDGRISGADYKELDIPAASAAGCWLVVFNEPSADIQVANIQMHQLDEIELTATPESGALYGTLAPGETITYAASYKGKSNQDAVVLFALYENGKLKSITPSDALKLNGSGSVVVKYTVPANAAKTGLSVKAFMWNSLAEMRPIATGVATLKQ